jgi:kumamolisin
MTARRHSKLMQLAGTKAAPLRGVRCVRTTRSTETMTLTLHLRSRADDPGALETALDDILAGRRPTLDRKRFAAEFGARRDDIAAIRRFANDNGLQVKGVSIPKRLIRISGTRARLSAAFGVDTVRYHLDGTHWNSFLGAIHLPRELSALVTGVFGFDDRADLSRHRVHAMAAAAPPEPKISYTAPEVANLYHYPRHLDGRGQSIGVIALGGGYRESDLRTYFDALELPMPKIRWKSIHGARNAPDGPTAAYDGEVTGDVETVGAIAPGASITVYFAHNTKRGFLEAVSEAVHDTKARNTVLSISWGQSEEQWRHGLLEAFNSVLLEAATLGVTVCCSSGDHGAYADADDRVPQVNFPGSSPYSLACGGTTLVGKRRTIVAERVWDNETGASGGGVSARFPLPAWQRKSRVPKTKKGFQGRGIPDVAANADPLTGYRCYLNGKWGVGAGTSAAAPVWAGLVARINQGCGTSVGLLTPFIYGRYDQLQEANALVPITRGNNGTYRARKGWSCCTGLGTPRGDKLCRAVGARRVKSEA